jgi:mediator of RNA polymerase II transcription subunit 4
MRQGLLFQMEGSMSGIGQTGQIGDGQSMIASAVGGCADGVENKQEDVVMAEAPMPAQIHREEQARRYDPEAVFSLDLNSDSDDE